MSEEKGIYNITFVSYLLLGKIDDCIKLLCETGRIPEAAFFARTYAPSKISEVVQLWRGDLKSISEKLAESLADPLEYENLFPDIKMAIQAEQYFKRKNLPASSYVDHKDDLQRDLIQGFFSFNLIQLNFSFLELKSLGISPVESLSPPQRQPESSQSSTQTSPQPPPQQQQHHDEEDLAKQLEAELEISDN